jgi:hypothetical protein
MLVDFVAEKPQAGNAYTVVFTQLTLPGQSSSDSTELWSGQELKIPGLSQKARQERGTRGG